jgi:hypothetical protein
MIDEYGHTDHHESSSKMLGEKWSGDMTTSRRAFLAWEMCWEEE